MTLDGREGGAVAFIYVVHLLGGLAGGLIVRPSPLQVPHGMGSRAPGGSTFLVVQERPLAGSPELSRVLKFSPLGNAQTPRPAPPRTQVSDAQDIS